MTSIYNFYPDLKTQEANHKAKAEAYGMLAQESPSLLKVINQFTAAMAEHGLHPIKEIVPGKWNRFPGEGKKRSNTAGWCLLFPDCTGGVFGDHSTGLHESWQVDRKRPQTPQERAELQRKIAAAKAAAQARREAEQANAAAKAVELISTAAPAQNHPYLAKKQVLPLGILQHGDRLLIPLQDIDGKIWSAQTIDRDGRKLFMSRGRTAGCFYLIGGPITQRVFICEGFATGATLYQYGQKIGAHGNLVVVAFNAGNLKPVALVIRARHPTAAITIAADNDTLTEGNPGLTKAREAAALVGGNVVWPNFDDMPAGGTDFNDYLLVGGVL